MKPEYYKVVVVVGGIVYRTGELLLDDAERAVASFELAAPNTSPQIIYVEVP